MSDIDPQQQLTAVFGALTDIARPIMAASIREVLERNETIVDQRPEALEHLVNELADCLIPKGLFG